MNSEKIYVVVPVYKVEAYLDRCISSILNQTYTNWKLILVDDGSPDNSPAICDRYAAAYVNVTVIHQENRGVSAARNTGIAYVQANAEQNEWMTFVDSDDCIHPNYLQFLLDGAKKTNADISSCSYQRVAMPPEQLPSLDDVRYEELSPEEYWVKDRTNAMIIWGKLYRVHCFNQVLYPTGVIHEDEFVTYKILFQSSVIATVDAALYYYCFNEHSIMHEQWSPKRLAGLDAFEEQIAFFNQENYPEARKLSTRELLQHSIKSVMFIKALSPKYDDLIKTVAARRRRAFRLYKKEVGLRKAAAYWYEVRIKAPMERVLGQESAFSFVKRRIKKKLRLN